MLTEDYINFYFDLHILVFNAMRKNALIDFKKSKKHCEIKDFKVKNLNVTYERKYTNAYNLKHEKYMSALSTSEKSLELVKITEPSIEQITPTKEKTLAEIKETKQIIENNQNGSNDEIKSTIIEKINDDYSWSRYGDYDLVMCNKNGFINASVLIEKAMNYENKIRSEINLPKISRKDFAKWMELKETPLLLQVVCYEKKVNTNDLFFNNNGVQKRSEKLLKGAYLHPDLINSLLMWVSPTYAHKINLFINKMNAETEKKNKEECIKALTQDIAEKSDLIVELRNAYNKIDNKCQIVIENNKLILQKLDNVLQINQVISGKLDRTNGHLQDIKHNVKIETRDKDLIIVFRIYGEGFNVDCYKLAKTTDDNMNASYSYYDKRYHCFPVSCLRTVNSKNICKKFLAENKNITYTASTAHLKIGYTEAAFVSDLERLIEKPVKTINKITI